MKRFGLGGIWAPIAVLTAQAWATSPDPAAIRAAQTQVKAAQAAGDEKAVIEAAMAWRAALGGLAGQPEGGEPPRIPADHRALPDGEAALAYLKNYREREAGKLDDFLAGLGEPTTLKAGLRQLAAAIIADGQVVRARMGPVEDATIEIRRLADALLGVQRPDGLFPFPDLRKTTPFFGRIIEKRLKERPTALVDGWLIDDGGSGDLQYDHGLCGVAMIEAHALTGDPKYLAAAKKAAEWVETQPIVPNWNYNAFSVRFLARLAEETKNRAYWDEAHRRCRLGMLPGQMENGRWFDPHNARLVYHSILTVALIEVLTAGKTLGTPAEDSDIETATRKALDAIADDVLNQGISVVTVPVEALALGLTRWRHDGRWNQALHATVHAGLTRQAKASEIGIYAASYLPCLRDLRR